MKWVRSFCLSVFLASSPTIGLAVTDTLRLSLQDVDALVRSRNYDVQLGLKEVQALRADARQTGSIDNPTLSAEIPAYTGGNRSWFDARGQFAIGVDQTLPISGARSYSQQAGMLGAQALESITQQTLREQLFAAKQAYITLYYTQKSFATLTRQLSLLEELVAGFNDQLNKGHVSLKDVLRLKASYYTVNDQRSDVYNDLIEARKVLQVLTGSVDIIVPGDTLVTSDDNIDDMSRDSLIAYAMKHRPEVAAAEALLNRSNALAKAERRKSIPEPSLGISYDKSGSYAPDYFALNLAIPIPIANTNGNAIEAADIRTSSMQNYIQQVRARITAEVLAAVDRRNIVHQEAAKVDAAYMDQSGQLTTGIIDNYRKGNVSLLEFVDYFETYNETIVRTNNLFATDIISIENIKLMVGL